MNQLDSVLNHSIVSELFAVPWTVACQAPLSMGILQVRILEWVAMPSSRGSSQSRDQTQATHTVGGFFTVWATREDQVNTGVCSLSLLQGIVPIQESNWGLLHCRQILYQLSYQESLSIVPTIYTACRFITKDISENFLIDCEISLLLPGGLNSSVTVIYNKGIRMHTMILVGGVLVASARGGMRLRTLKY